MAVHRLQMRINVMMCQHISVAKSMPMNLMMMMEVMLSLEVLMMMRRRKGRRLITAEHNRARGQQEHEYIAQSHCTVDVGQLCSSSCTVINVVISIHATQ